MSNIFFETFRTSLDPITNNNTRLWKELLVAKLKSSCEKDENLVLNSVIEAAQQQNQALQNELQRVKNKATFETQEPMDNNGVAMTQEKVNDLSLKPPQELEAGENCPTEEMKALQDKRQEFVSKVEIDRTNELLKQLEKKIALLSKQTSYVQELYQGLESKLTQADALKENDTTLEGGRELCKKVSRTDTVQEELEDLEEDTDEYCVQFKEELCEENQAMDEGCEELGKKVFHRDTVQEESRKLEEELQMLRDQNSNLQEEFECLKSKLSQENTDELYIRLEMEKDRCSRENTQLREEISKLIKKLARESCWKNQAEAIQVSKAALERQNILLNDHLWNLSKAFDEEMLKVHEFKEKDRRTVELNLINNNIEQKIDQMEQEMIDVKAKLESYKHRNTIEADLKNINKKLEKKKIKLEKELQKFKTSEDDTQKILHDTCEVRQEHLRLYKDILVLQDRIAKKKLLEANLKRLKREKKPLVRRQNGLRKKVSDSGGKMRLVDRLVAESKKCKEEVDNLRRTNDQLQSQYEEVLAAIYTQEILEFSNEDSKKEIEEMKKLNKTQRLDVRRAKIRLPKYKGWASEEQWLGIRRTKVGHQKNNQGRPSSAV